MASHAATTSHTYTVIAQIPAGLYVGNLVGLNGALYGPASPTSGTGAPSVVEITTGGTVQTVHTFSSGEADWLSTDNANTVYGVSNTGANGDGYAFAITGGVYREVYDFPYLGRYGRPEGPVLNINGTLYGTCDAGIYAIWPSGWVQLIRVAGSPVGRLVTLNGTMYAMTSSFGGRGNSVVAISPATGTVTTIFSGGFSTLAPTGFNDLTVLDGSLASVSYSGIDGAYNGAYGHGSVFELLPHKSSAHLTILHIFDPVTDDVINPVNGVTAYDGNLYGTTPTFIYEVTSTGEWSVIHSSVPRLPGLVETLTVANGLLYGTSYESLLATNESVFSIAP